MRVTIRRSGVIINIIIAENLDITSALYPGCEVTSESPTDEIDRGESKKEEETEETV